MILRYCRSWSPRRRSGGFDHAFRHVRVADHAVWGWRSAAELTVSRDFAVSAALSFATESSSTARFFSFAASSFFRSPDRYPRRVFRASTLLSCDSNGREGFTRDGVTQCTAVEINKTQVQFYLHGPPGSAPAVCWHCPGPGGISPPE